MQGVRRERLEFVSREAEAERIINAVKIKEETTINDTFTIKTNTTGLSVKKFQESRGRPLL